MNWTEQELKDPKVRRAYEEHIVATHQQAMRDRDFDLIAWCMKARAELINERMRKQRKEARLVTPVVHIATKPASAKKSASANGTSKMRAADWVYSTILTHVCKAYDAWHNSPDVKPEPVMTPMTLRKHLDKQTDRPDIYRTASARERLAVVSAGLKLLESSGKLTWSWDDAGKCYEPAEQRDEG